MARNRQSMPSTAYDRECMLSLNAPGEYERFLQDGVLRPRLARAVSLAGLRPGQRVLDAGSGRGEVALRCAREGSHVLAVDYSRDCAMLTARAAQQARCEAPGRVFPILGDSRCLPLPANSVQRVLMLDVLEHLYPWEMELALAEAQRVLEPGGYLVIHTLPNRWALDIGYALARLFFRRLPADPRSERERAIHVNEQDIVGLHRALARAGFAARVWLEDSIIAQARWQQGGRAFPPSDRRARVYPLLANAFLRGLYRLVLATPFRLVLANDIYAVAFKGSLPPGKRWGKTLERLVTWATPATADRDGKP